MDPTDTPQQHPEAARFHPAAPMIGGVSINRWITFAGLALFAIVVVRNAWLSDDALITFRSIENWLTGNGLRFNPLERVQSYTHPLWLALLTPFYALSGEAFYTPIGVSIAVSLAALSVVALPLRDGRRAIAALSCLVASKAFVDYTTSGLENALLYLLLAVFATLYLAPVALTRGRFRTLAFLAALLALTRLDAALLVAPACLELLVRRVRAHERNSRWVIDGLIGAAPLLLWLAFAILYYGTPLPNTAYSKLNTGIASELLRLQGLTYLRSSFHYDPITLVLIAAGAAAAVLGPRARLIPLGLGALLYVAYTIPIGGDFMTGRFFAAPLLLCILVIARSRVPLPAFGGLGAIAIAVSLLSPLAPVRSGSDYFNHDPEQVRRLGGIADERGFYYPVRGLLSPYRSVPLHAGSRCGVGGEPDTGRWPRVEVRAECGGLGIAGLTSCPLTHLIDPCALSDPMLARMPVMRAHRWRVGHYRRRLPINYVASIEAGRNIIEDPSLKALYDDVVIVTRDPLFAPGRLRAILRLNFHDYFSFSDPFSNDSAMQAEPAASDPTQALGSPPGSESRRRTPASRE